MNWLKWLDAIAAADNAPPQLDPVSEEEARLYCEAITRHTEATDQRERREPWVQRYGETWEQWLARSAAQQPRRERDDG